jgi:hypothetical protein
MQRLYSWKVICARCAGCGLSKGVHFGGSFLLTLSFLLTSLLFVFNTQSLSFPVSKRQDDLCEPHDFELGDENYAEDAGEGQGRPMYFAVDATPKDVANSQSYGIYSLPDAELQMVMDAFAVRLCLHFC